MLEIPQFIERPSEKEGVDRGGVGAHESQNCLEGSSLQSPSQSRWIPKCGMR